MAEHVNVHMYCSKIYKSTGAICLVVLIIGIYLGRNLYDPNYFHLIPILLRRTAKRILTSRKALALTYS
jgi:hypothetical protein